MVTQTHSPFETLARVIEHLDDDGRSVRRTEAAGSGEDGALRATVDVSVGTPSEDFEPADATVDDGLSVTFHTPGFPDPTAALPTASPRVSTTPTDVWLDGDSVVVTLAVTIGDPDRRGGAEDAADSTPVDATGEEAPTDAAESAAAATFGEQSTDEEPDLETSDADRSESETSDADGSGTEADGTDTGAASSLAAVRDESVPPYDDTPYLRRLYETCGTFAEMSERIGMDVSAETVRRYMIEADVHSPTSYETADDRRNSSGGAADTTDGSEAAAETTASGDVSTDDGAAAAAVRHGDSAAGGDPVASLPDEQLVADGIGLPEELTLHAVVDAVVDARTVHEVQREIGLGYDRTRQLLSQLNVLDLVVGRVSQESDRAVTVDLVADRIRQCAPDAA